MDAAFKTNSEMKYKYGSEGDFDAVNLIKDTEDFRLGQITRAKSETGSFGVSRTRIESSHNDRSK